LVEELGNHGFVRQGTQCDGSDEFFAGRGDDHLHLGTFFYEQADKQASLVGGYAARYAQDNLFTFQHIKLLDRANLL
jgi:hypothetical protein